MIEFRNRTPVHSVLLFRSIDLRIDCCSKALASCYLVAYSFQNFNVELVGRSTSFLSFHVLNTVNLIRVINESQQFQSYRTIYLRI